ncbi:MAG: hypothetical protein EBY65_09410, partial [Acidimicrobiia bacterium]|nr:hypothetical protein [Acidimicrobiia bacterium]
WLATSGFQVTELDLRADDRVLCPFPVVNMAGIGGMLLTWVETGCFLALHHPLDLQVFLGQIPAERISYTVVPPAALNMLLANDAMLDQLDLSSIRKIASGSAPLDPWMVEGWQARGIEIVNVFGSNEGAAMMSTMAAVPDPTERARYFPVPEREGVEIQCGRARGVDRRPSRHRGVRSRRLPRSGSRREGRGVRSSSARCRSTVAFGRDRSPARA